MQTYIFWILLLAYAVHILEEYMLDWKKWVFHLTKMEVQWVDFYVINAAVVVLGICFALIGFKNPSVSFMFPALMIINGLFFHILPSVVFRHFSPGLITSVVLFLPLPAMAYYEAFRLDLLNPAMLFVSTSGGIVMMAIPVLFQRMKKKHL